jgi:hypothetical protein
MRFIELITADIHRDGGSYEAIFKTDEGGEHGVWLQRSAMPHAGGLHHRWLFEYPGREQPEGCLPIVTGSDQERDLVRRISELLSGHEGAAPSSREDARRRLEEMLSYIRVREPCFPADLRAAGFIA